MKYIIEKIWLARDSKSNLWEVFVWLPGIKLILKERKNSISEENYLSVIDLNSFNKFTREIFKLCHLRHLSWEEVAQDIV